MWRNGPERHKSPSWKEINVLMWALQKCYKWTSATLNRVQALRGPEVASAAVAIGEQLPCAGNDIRQRDNQMLAANRRVSPHYWLQTVSEHIVWRK